MNDTFSKTVAGVLVACALVVAVAVVRQAFWTPAPPPPPSSEPRAVDGEYVQRTSAAGESRSWATGPWLELDSKNTRTATGYGLDDFDNVALDLKGRAHVVDRSSKKVVVFDPDLQFIHAVALSPADQEIGIDMLGTDSIAVLDWRTGLASVRSTRTGEVASHFRLFA